MSIQPAAPAAPQKTSREIIISDWKAHNKNTLRGFFSLTLPSGMVIHDCMLHEKNDSRWISLPARSYTDTEGKQQFARFIDFTSKEIKTRFENEVLAALDHYFAVMKTPL